MTVMPTLEGGLRIDAEDASDWELLRSIIVDANCCKTDLADRLGSLMGKDVGGEDWEELVVPDLREGFQDELAEIGALIESAIFNATSGPGPLWITPGDAFPWYSSLNQARLALEETYHFGPSETIHLAGLPVAHRSAFIRSQFYCAVQSLLLDHVMR